ncbi:hypothetical protein MNBD_CHLOROFLEXI01-2146 [hydrothermal vent metagenome]|uniref:Cytochrome c domain-containing protein n=1 Tax=hydrothermal vent metagenome TaxID=652676 RepID=A0A3B0WI32_9ZZZZ
MKYPQPRPMLKQRATKPSPFGANLAPKGLSPLAPSFTTGRWFLLVITLFLLAACQSAQPAKEPNPAPNSTLFTNVNRAAGIVNTRQGNDRAIGQAWGDIDRDGWVDFYVTDTAGPNSLFRNNGDGTFSRSPHDQTVALPNAYSGGASFADYNNDGWLDLYVVNWGANRLFRNQAGQGFIDVTAQAGVGDEANGQTASWGDYDNDGWLDLYVANWACYPRCGRPNQGDTDRLYHNNGDGTFRDVTRLLSGKTNGAGFVASFTDYDNDGDLDIYLVNDEFLFPIGNKLWRNDGPGCDGHCFTEVAAEAGADTRVMGMGLATADYDNDGDFDFYFSNAGPMTLLQNQGDGTFADVAAQAGVDMPGNIAWAATAFDYDNDGWQDLYLAVMTTANHGGIPANPLFHNNGDGTFTRVRSGSGAADVGPTMGIATADFDNDGWVDLLIGNKDDGYSLLRNQVGAQSGNRWFALQLVGGGPINRDAIGARVTVRSADGSVQTREVQSGGSLGAGNELKLHFGLGTAVSIPKLTIVWPNGRMQQWQNVPTNQQVTLTYPSNAAVEAAQLTALYPAILPEKESNPPSLPAITLVVVVGLLITAVISQYPTLRRWPRWGMGLGLLTILALLGVIWMTAYATSSNPNRSLRRLLNQAGAAVPQQLPPAPAAKVALGEALFWDPILSGNQDIACVTCHQPLFATGDGLSLSIGTGGQGLGPERKLLPTARQLLIPRNASPIFNLGLEGMDVLFWDGRVQGTVATTFDTPANDDLPFGLDNAIAAQAMFPVTSRDEMRGHRGSRDIFGERNPFASINDHQWPAIWDEIMIRVLTIPAYQELFAAAYPDIPLGELRFEQVANGLAAYQMETFTFLDSPWDRYLQGDEAAISPLAREGARLFYGDAGCAQCHSGPLLSDMQFYNIGVPQIGPGKGFEAPLDFGRARETGDESDLFAFRTPPLRNVAISGPWMHNGAYVSLETAVIHHLNPAQAVTNYDFGQLSPLVLAEDSGETAVHTAALNAPSFYMPRVTLTNEEVTALLTFLDSLTSPSAKDLAHLIPDAVPSGLRVGGE